MDRRQIELQIRTIVVIYRGEARRNDSIVMHAFRRRAEALLAELEPAVEPYPDLAEHLAEARREILEGES